MKVAVRRAGGPGRLGELDVYPVELESTRTVLDALLWIEEYADPTLAFRRMCRSGICGTCAGLVNGVPRLLCQTLLQDVLEAPPETVDAEVVVEPLPQYRVLKDLVVDMEPFVKEFTRVRAWVQPDPGYDGLVSSETMVRLWPVARCVMCGICAEGGDQSVPHPAAVAKLLRLVVDPRDGAPLERTAVLQRLTAADLQRVVDRLRALCPAGVEVEPLVGIVRAGRSLDE
jgi:succinate dehydrogenase / fumarate reductase iron-sulfur subunit